jgi:hypothetical protein
MARAKDELSKGMPTGRVMFYCPACKDTHALTVGGDKHPCWGFNGNYDKPTFTPSVLVKSGHYCDGRTENCWCRWAERHLGEEPPFKCGICHSFVTDGHIRYLADCTHSMAGQTVELPDVDTGGA